MIKGKEVKYDARRFSQESYDRNDKLAKDIFIKWAKSTGHDIVSSVEDYNHDVITIKDGKNYAFELEMKNTYWTCREDFPFSTVSFLGRKKRLHKKQPFIYIIISAKSDYAVMCSSNVVYDEKNSELVGINTKERSGLDELYRVPKKDCTFFKIK